MVAAKRKVSASDFTFGPKQKSLFCFFSKPSANPYAATTCGHPSSQLLGDSSPAGSDECGKDSDSSSMQDVDRLQCSELLPGLLTHAGTQSVSVKGSFFSDNAVTRENEDFLAASLTGRTSFDGVDGINDFGDYAFGNACQNNGSRTLRAVKIYKRTRSQLADVRGPCLATHAVYKSIGSQNEAGRPFYSISHETSEPMKHIHEPISLEMDAPCQSLPLGNAIKTYSGRNTSEKDSVLPVRRSRRLIQESIGRTQYKDEETVDQTTNDAPIEEDPVFYDDSSVLKYTCGEEVVNISSRYSEDFAKFGEANIIGFHPSDGGLQDKHLTRIYSMSVCFVSQCRRTLLAAGGHQGQIAVFGFASPLGSEEETASESDCSSNPVYREPLLSWKGSTGWISGVKFLSVKDRENVNLLLSSANDGKLILWDINKQQKLQQTSKSLERLPPMKVTEASNIHTNGIFSMQECSGHVVTASKDGTLGCSKITNQDIIMERSVSGHHMGAIRGVNFRDSSILADCGNDGLICILDLRMAEACTLSIDAAVTGGVNVVEWSPVKEHLLLSASKDPLIPLYDIRNAREPVHRLCGHVNQKLQRCSHIYRPTFVADGSAIATPGQGSKALSLYSVDTGKAISRGHLGYDATMVMWANDAKESTSVLWVASRHISPLIPLWQGVNSG